MPNQIGSSEITNIDKPAGTLATPMTGVAFPDASDHDTTWRPGEAQKPIAVIEIEENTPWGKAAVGEKPESAHAYPGPRPSNSSRFYQAGKFLRNARNQLTNTVKENPGPSLWVGLGVGCALGLLTAKSRRRN